jgi:hypothetical protein
MDPWTFSLPGLRPVGRGSLVPIARPVPARDTPPGYDVVRLEYGAVEYLSTDVNE